MTLALTLLAALAVTALTLLALGIPLLVAAARREAHVRPHRLHPSLYPR